MDEGVKGMIIFGVVLTVSVGFLIVKKLRTRAGHNDLRPTDVDPRAQQVRQALAAGQPMALVGFLQSLGPDWDARAFYLEHLVTFCTRESLDALCAQQPSPIALLVRGCHAVKWAWEARGSGSADSVSESARQLFQQRLALAERDLSMAAQADPADPTTFANLITVAKAMGAPREVALNHFNAATARQPDHYLAHEQMRSYLSRRWHGSDEEMLGFVRHRVASAPPGSDLPMLIVQAHLDVWSYIHTFEDNAQHAMQYLMHPAIRQEIQGAYAQSLGGPCRVRASTVHYRNAAAFAFFLLQDVPMARLEHERIAGAYAEYPWVYFRSGEQETGDVVATSRLVAGLR